MRGSRPSWCRGSAPTSRRPGACSVRSSSRPVPRARGCGSSEGGGSPLSAVRAACYPSAMRMRALAAVMVLQAIGCGGKKDDAPAAVRSTAPAAGSAADITEDEYAKRLIAELQKHGGKPTLHYDAAHAEVTDGEMHV